MLGLPFMWVAVDPVDATPAVAMQAASEAASATAEAAAAIAALAVAVVVDVAALAVAVEMMMGMVVHAGALLKVELMMSGRSDDVLGAQGREWHVKKACSSVSRPWSYRASSSGDCADAPSAHSTRRRGWYRGVRPSGAFSGALVEVARSSVVPMQLGCCRGLQPTTRLAVKTSRVSSSQVKSSQLADKIHYHASTRPARRGPDRRQRRRSPQCSRRRTAKPPSPRCSPSWQRRLAPSQASQPNSRLV